MYVCSNCLFCDAVEDEDYCACQLRQSLVMPFDKVCDFFELNRKTIKEIDKVTMDLNGVNEYTNDLQDEYTNTTELPKAKIVDQVGDDIFKVILSTMEDSYPEDTAPRKPSFFSVDSTCDCDYCNANSFPKLNNFGDEDYEDFTDDEIQIELMIDDLDSAAEDVMEALSFLGDGLTPRDVLAPILGLEASIALLKRFLLEYEE